MAIAAELRRRGLAGAAARPEPEFRGAALEFVQSTAREVVIHGPARTGKTFAGLWKLDHYASRYPRCRMLLLRKTRESMSESVLVTLEEDVLGENHPALGGEVRRENRRAYVYPNGSEIIVAGLLQSNKDQKAKIMSTEYDMIFVPEATELRESEYSKLLTRLSHNRMPFQQMLADCNPDAPLHWLYQRQFSGMPFLASRLKDNPKFHDGVNWNQTGLEYLATLELLTGAERARLKEGQWVQASGLVFDVWSDGPADGNVTEAAEYQADAGDVLWVVDDGYAGQLEPHTGEFTADSHPRAFLLVQLKPDGHLDVFAESYAVKKLSDVHISEVKALGYPDPTYAIIGPGFAELTGRLHAAGVYTRKVQEEVEETIKVARRFLSPDANGWRRIRVHPRCKHLRSEMVSYRRDPASGKVIKEHDHGPDGVRYLAWSLRHG